MVKILLTQNQVAIVDNCDAHLRNWKWYAWYSKHSKSFYAVRTWGRHKERGSTWLHQAVMGRPIDRNMKTDHINGNSLDNRRKNLRFITNRENISNQKRKISGKCSSMFTGVVWVEKRKKWKSSITIGGIHKFLGEFVNELDAHGAYQSALESLS